MSQTDQKVDKSARLRVPGQLGEPVVKALSGKRFALIGFDEKEFLQISQAIEQLQGFARRMTITEIPELNQAFDLIVFRIDADDTSVVSQAAAKLKKPFLLAGNVDSVMIHLDDRTIEAHDFVIWPTQPAELLMRAYNVLSASQLRADSIKVTKREKPLVIVADDDSTTTMMVKAVLQRFGMDAQTATNGSQALEMAQQLLPDVLVLDVNMPFMDGFEVLSSIKRNAQTKHIFVVMLTSVRQEADIARGFAMGADDYVIKPFNPIELVARVKRFVKRPV